MRTLDASSVLHGWHQYPPDRFPKLWAWLGEEAVAGRLTIPLVAMQEVRKHEPAAAAWLKDHDTLVLPVTQEITTTSLAIRRELGVARGHFLGTGVGANDVMIIATAREHDAELVSNEAVQSQPPKNPYDRKIPAVCSMPSVRVFCGNFLRLLKQGPGPYG